METGYDNFVNNLIGPSPLFPSTTSKYNYGASLKPNQPVEKDCNTLYKSIPNLKTGKMKNANALITNFQSSKTYTIFKEMAETDCDFSKVYPIEFSCSKKLKFLFSRYDIFYEICVEDEAEENLTYKSIPLGSRIPVMNDYYMVI